jgi:hypothetical protein
MHCDVDRVFADLSQKRFKTSRRPAGFRGWEISVFAKEFEDDGCMAEQWTIQRSDVVAAAATSVHGGECQR